MADAGITIKLKGDRDLVAAINELRDYLPRYFLASALRSSADRMRRVIIAFAPKRTGRLARAITVKSRTKQGTSRAQVIVSTAGKRNDPENAFYWRFLERGWHDRAGIPHQVQFIKPAFETEANDAAQNVINQVERALARAERRAG